jgi:predicted DNA-binding transcriptional regulator AlpA
MPEPPPLSPATADTAPTDPVEALRDHPAAGRPASLAAAVEPLLVPATVAGPLCGRSEASWWRDHAANRIPAPIKLGGRTLWRVAELRAWVEAGCPSRREWEARQAGARALGRKGGQP